MGISQDNKPSPFGRGLAIDDGDLRLVKGGAGNRDFATIAGRENLLQSLRLMVETPFGSDIFNVNYGFDFLSVIGQPQSVRAVKDLIRLQVVKSLSQDDRVREINEVVFDDEPRFFELDASATVESALAGHKRARRWRALVSLETVADGEVTVQVEGTKV
jgi:phage baseplate assembly protein W